MDLVSAGLREQPFRTHGRPLVVVPYASHTAALTALDDMLECRHGLVLLQGPPLSGKTTILREFAEGLGDERAVAMINGSGLNTAGLLLQALRQFGYDIDSNSTSELLAMLRVFCMQQTASHRPPVIIIENTHELNPSAMRAVVELANLRVRQDMAVRLVLSSNRCLDELISADALRPIARRISANHHLRPMSSEEARRFLHTKLVAAGAETPDTVIPRALSQEFFEASGGWPGILDRIALLAIAKSASLPISIDNVERPSLPRGTWHGNAGTETKKDVHHARLVLTNGGKTVRELDFDRPRILIGRSEHNDIAIDSKFISRHHLLLVRHGKTTFLMDLNSTNGTHVNSQRVSNQVLLHGDIISVGQYRIKFYDPQARSTGDVQLDVGDTAIMKTLQDMRTLLAQENTTIMPAQRDGTSEQIPTYVPDTPPNRSA